MDAPSSDGPVRLRACTEDDLGFRAAVLPEHRGRGIGSAAQRLLVEYLRDVTTANRIEALTNGGNLGEQSTRERLGFRPRPRARAGCSGPRSIGAARRGVTSRASPARCAALPSGPCP